MNAPDFLRAREVGNSPRNPQNAGVTSCRKAHCFSRLREQFLPGIIRCRTVFQHFTIQLCICTRLLTLQPDVLNLSGNADARSYFG